MIDDYDLKKNKKRNEAPFWCPSEEQTKITLQLQPCKTPSSKRVLTSDEITTLEGWVIFLI